MLKPMVETYSFAEISPMSTSKDLNHLKVPTNNDTLKARSTEQSSSERVGHGRVRFLEPSAANDAAPIQSKSMKKVPSFESLETQSIGNYSDVQSDGPNSVSRGLQTDISNASVIDWVLGQKSSSTADRYIKT